MLAATVAVCVAAGAGAAAGVYALSFWHYLLYLLAFLFGRVAAADFRRDAMLMKGVALAALAAVYFAQPIDPLSVAVAAAGFLLNAAAARVLGPERTYYGRELADLPPLRVTAFPYSLLAHPMLAGNVIAFGGTLLNAPFRAAWWPLAAAHVALNLGLLAMETRLKPLRRPAPVLARAAVGAAALGAAAGLAAGPGETAPAVPIAAAIVLYAFLVHRHYTPGAKGLP